MRIRLEGESFALLLQSDLDDPTDAFASLDIVGRRLLPPTRFLRSGAMTVDPILLRGASLGAAWGADRAGAAGALYHVAGAGPLPIAPGLPVVVTLLDLAPWEMPDVFGRSAAGRFGRRLRSQQLRDAAAVIVGTQATARAAVRLLHLKRDRIRVIPLAPRPAYAFWGSDAASASDLATSAHELAAQRERLGLPERYLVYPGRYDARQDLATLLETLAALAADGRPAGLPARRRVAAACPARGRDSRGSGRPGQGGGEAGRRRGADLRPRVDRGRVGPRSFAAPGPPSCPSSPRPPACRSSKPSRAARRSSRQRWAPCRNSWRGRSARGAARPGSTGGRAARDLGGRRGPWRRRRRGPRPGRVGPPDVGGCRARDAGRLRGRRDPDLAEPTDAQRADGA